MDTPKFLESHRQSRCPEQRFPKAGDSMKELSSGVSPSASDFGRHEVVFSPGPGEDSVSQCLWLNLVLNSPLSLKLLRG